MTTEYKVEISGTFVGLPCVGGADVMVNGQQIRLPDALLSLVAPPLPDEPPNLSVVLSIEADGTRWVFERDEDGDEGRTFTHSGTWCTTASPSEYEWGEVVGKDANGTPVLLVPAPEPVALPWAHTDRFGDRLEIGKPDNVGNVTVRAIADAGEGVITVVVPAAKLFGTAADEADRRVSDER